MIELVTYDSNFHAIFVQRWWESRQGVDFPLRMLPDIGRVALSNRQPIAMAFLYTTNSKVGWIGWPVSDPEASKELRSETLDIVLESLHEVAKAKGIELIWTTSGIPALQKRFEELGYVVGDTGINQYFKELKWEQPQQS